MARKKARLTRKKSSKKVVKQSSDTLSPQEFAALPQKYGKFSIEDASHESIEFEVGNTAYVQWKDLEGDAVVPERDYWIGKVEEIRGYDADEVWVCVQWFWSPQDVAEVVQSFDPAICGEYEVLSSDNTDIVSVHCFFGTWKKICSLAHVEVKEFIENRRDQIPIGDGEWFTRYTFLYNGRRISPKVTEHACSICRIPYTPGKQKTLVFCPRHDCCKFYHQACLVKNDYVETVRSHRLLETWPGCSRIIPVEVLRDICPPRKRQKLSKSRSTSGAVDLLSGFPPLLIATADQHIVRGTQDGGIVGNIASVVAARQLIYNALVEGSDIPDGWQQTIDLSSATPETTSTHPNMICPSCRSSI